MNPRNCLFNSIRRTYRAIDTAWTGEIGSCVDFLGVEKSDYLQGGHVEVRPGHVHLEQPIMMKIADRLQILKTG